MDEERDEEFDYLRGQSPEQREAADDVEPFVEDAPASGGEGAGGEDADREAPRERQAGL